MQERVQIILAAGTLEFAHKDGSIDGDFFKGVF
jgi:hypothetical protein